VLNEQALAKLVSGYSSHGFVISRSEAAMLLPNVREPNESEIELAAKLGPEIWRLPFQPTRVDYDRVRQEPEVSSKGESDVTQRGDAADPKTEIEAGQGDRPGADGNGSAALVDTPSSSSRPSAANQKPNGRKSARKHV